MTRHPARFSEEEAPGVGAAIRFAMEEARRIRKLGEASSLPSEQYLARMESTALDAFAGRLRAML